MSATTESRIDVGRRRRYRLDNAATSLRAARRAVKGRAELGPYPELSFIAQLLTTELVSNTVLHAKLTADDALSLTIECDGRTLRVQVADDGRGFDPLSQLARYRRTGSRRHGLYLLDALADRWGYRCVKGAEIWFEIDLVPSRRPWHGREPAPRASDRDVRAL
jgi:anti-sigma regulatory factor (Ser/Thr protein kinase)